MVVVQLSPELVTLVHHVELNKADWQDKTIHRLLSSVLWLSSGPVARDELRETIVREFGMNISSDALNKHLAVLAEAQSIAILPDGRCKLTETFRDTLDRQLADFESVENAVQDRFEASIAEQASGMTSPPSWGQFREDAYLPMLREIGARAYEILSGDISRLRGSASISAFLETAPVPDRPALRLAILDFLDPNDKAVRTHMLGHVHAFLCLDAGHLSPGTIKAIVDAAGIKKTLRLLVDTNFLFSLLGLHDNPSNEAAESLKALLKEAQEYIDVRMYVLPQTLEEARKVLLAHKNVISEYRAVTALHRIALQQEISGITRRYFERGAKNSLSPDDYFSPYLSSLPTIVRGHGIEVYNESLDDYRMRQDVVDDINGQLTYEEAAHGDPSKKKKPKKYESLEHDITLWHFAMDHQKDRAGGVADGGFMIVTIDYRFIAFDRFKRRRMAGTLPAVAHPAPLVQSLGFYVPRSEQFEKAVVDSVRLPFLFEPFDPEAERVSLKIVSRISQFENIGTFSNGAIANIIVNTALRERFAHGQTADEEIQLIETALAEEHAKVQQELAREKKASKQRQKKIDQLAASMATKDDDLETLQGQLGKLGHAQVESEKRITSLANELQNKERQFIAAKTIRRYVTWIVLALLIGTAVMAGIGYIVAEHTSIQVWRIIVGLSAAYCVLWLYVCKRIGEGHSPVRARGWFKLLRKSWVFLALILIGATATALYEMIAAFVAAIFSGKQ